MHLKNDKTTPVGRIILFGIIKKSNHIKQEINKKVKLKHFELSLGQGESV